VKVVADADTTTGPGDASRFTGDVWQTEFLDRVQDDGLRGHRFTYAPGARSHWHIHTGEQALIVVTGRGLLQWEGLEAPRQLEPGDWVHVVPGVLHWHGAAPDSTFVHLAVTATGTTYWRDAVGDDAYLAGR